MLWVRILIRTRCTTLCDKVCQSLVTGRWFSPGPPVSSTNKTDRHYIWNIVESGVKHHQTNKKPLHYLSFVWRLLTFSLVSSNCCAFWINSKECANSRMYMYNAIFTNGTLVNHWSLLWVICSKHTNVELFPIRKVWRYQRGNHMP